MNVDYLAIAGIVLLVGGVGLFSIPLALVVLGCIMVGIAGLISWVRVTEKRKRGPEDDSE